VLLFGALTPPLAALCGVACERSLAVLEWMVEVTQNALDLHYWTPGPAAWWVGGCYAALAAWASFPRLHLPRRWLLTLVACWMAVGLLPSDQGFPSVAGDRPLGHRAGLLGASNIGGSRDELACTFIAVGHGVSVVVYVSPVMFDDETPALAVLRAAIDATGVPLKETSLGDRLVGNDGVLAEVRHPPPRGTLGTDNANSIVLDISAHGRRILLTGDLEGTPLAELLEEEPVDYDVALAPHHGSNFSNPPGFAAWATPDVTVISGGAGDISEEVKQAYRAYGSSVYHTAEVGAVRVTIRPEGMYTQTWRDLQD
jgi:hypothetical protein